MKPKTQARGMIAATVTDGSTPPSPSVTRVVRSTKAPRRYLRIEGNASQRTVQSERPGTKSRQVTSGGGTHNQTHQTQHRGTGTAIQKIEKTEILGEKVERIKKPERSKHRTPRQPVSPKKHHSSQPRMKPTSVRRYVQAQIFPPDRVGADQDQTAASRDGAVPLPPDGSRIQSYVNPTPKGDTKGSNRVYAIRRGSRNGEAA